MPEPHIKFRPDVARRLSPEITIMDNKDLLKQIKDVNQAAAQFPGLDITEAYERFKKQKGETPTYLNSSEQSTRETQISRYTLRPCSHKPCSGKMHLEQICPSCVEGRAGYQSKWTCDTCFHRKLSKKDYSDWFR